MKILMVSEDLPNPTLGGLGKHALTLAKAMVKTGHTVDFMGSKRHSDLISELHRDGFSGEFLPDIKFPGGYWKEARLGIFNPLRRPVQARELAQCILAYEGKYDAIHYHGHMPDVAAYVPRNINFIQTRHDQGADCLTHVRFRGGEICNSIDPSDCASCANGGEPAGLWRTMISTTAVQQFRQRVMLGFARHKTIFVSEMLQRNIARSFGLGPWGQVVHNFVDAELISRIAPSQLAERADTEVFVAGRLCEPKGITEFLRLFVARSPPTLRVRVAGTGPDEAIIQATISNDTTRLLGWLDYEQTIAAARAADVIVVPSIWEEPCATTVLEALCLGKQCHALRRGGTPELVRYERYSGQLVLHDNLEDLVASISARDRYSQIALRPISAPDYTGDVHQRIGDIIKVYEASR